MIKRHSMKQIANLKTSICIMMGGETKNVELNNRKIGLIRARSHAKRLQTLQALQKLLNLVDLLLFSLKKIKQ